MFFFESIHSFDSCFINLVAKVKKMLMMFLKSNGMSGNEICTGKDRIGGWKKVICLGNVEWKNRVGSCSSKIW